MSVELGVFLKEINRCSNRHGCILSFMLDDFPNSSPSSSCLWAWEHCVYPWPDDRTPLVKLCLVFLLHSSLEPCAESSPQDALDRQKCLTSLASLRQAKWFQVCIPSLFV